MEIALSSSKNSAIDIRTERKPSDMEYADHVCCLPKIQDRLDVSVDRFGMRFGP